MRVLREEVLPRPEEGPDEALRVAEVREEAEREAPLRLVVEAPVERLPVDRLPVDPEPDFAVDDRRVVVAIAIVR